MLDILKYFFKTNVKTATTFLRKKLVTKKNLHVVQNFMTVILATLDFFWKFFLASDQKYH